MEPPEETERQRVNRELQELVQELRVALPGVQVLFGFLLSVAFSERFTRLDAGEKRVYLTAILSATVATVLIIAPAAHHRLRFRSGDKEQMLKVGTILAGAGTAMLAVSISATLHVVTRLIYGPGPAALVAALAAGFSAAVWFVVPVLYRRSPRPEDDGLLG